MSVIIATRHVRHLGILLKTHNPGFGWLIVEWVPVCGSPARVGTAGTTFVWPTSPDQLKARPQCTHCLATAEELFQMAADG